MNIEVGFWLVAFLGLVVLGFFSLFGSVNITLAIAFASLYIGSEVWLGLDKIAKTINEKE